MDDIVTNIEETKHILESDIARISDLINIPRDLDR